MKPAKPIKIKITHDELSTLLVVLRNYVKENSPPMFTLDQLIHVIIYRLTIRIAKRLLDNKNKYTLALSHDEALAFNHLYEERISHYGNQWTANLMLMIFNQTHRQLIMPS
jgi:hypothetical protein